MAENPIVFAMANPEPEIMPDRALNAGCAVIGTGRSDFSNQINNVLAFPGIFKGALKARAKTISTEMKLAAAHAIASAVEKPTKDMVIPNALDRHWQTALRKQSKAVYDEAEMKKRIAAADAEYDALG